MILAGGPPAPTGPRGCDESNRAGKEGHGEPASARLSAAAPGACGTVDAREGDPRAEGAEGTTGAQRRGEDREADANGGHEADAH